LIGSGAYIVGRMEYIYRDSPPDHLVFGSSVPVKVQFPKLRDQSILFRCKNR
jgi:hypothetical protein